MERDKLHLLKKVIESAENSIISAKEIIADMEGKPVKESRAIKEKAQNLSELEKDRVIEGVFDGESMIGPDNNVYPVHPNYASKSKLIPGDILKLTIDNEGSFIFKQIEPAPRKQITGELVEDNGDFRVIAEGKAYKVLLASITYYKASAGDTVVITVPEEDTENEWAAVENIIKKS
ncbi:hypothetical protein HGB13_01175 [bacterium]|nr:hypothetical protein [bacterium]